MADINNQLTINVLNALRENVKNSSRTVGATSEFNSNMATDMDIILFIGPATVYY